MKLQEALAARDTLKAAQERFLGLHAAIVREEKRYTDQLDRLEERSFFRAQFHDPAFPPDEDGHYNHGFDRSWGYTSVDDDWRVEFDRQGDRILVTFTSPYADSTTGCYDVHQWWCAVSMFEADDPESPRRWVEWRVETIEERAVEWKRTEPEREAERRAEEHENLRREFERLRAIFEPN